MKAQLTVHLPGSLGNDKRKSGRVERAGPGDLCSLTTLRQRYLANNAHDTGLNHLDVGTRDF